MPRRTQMWKEEEEEAAVSASRPQRAAPMAPSLLSPTPHPGLLIGSNDDQLERARSRAARAAALRRKTAALHPTPAASGRPDFVEREQLMELYRNCLRLASENKINQKNTWELGLIDHLSEIIQVETEEENKPNFQKASCTLEAGVKIYSLRVDSVHSEAYKVLGGINRARREDDSENTIERSHMKAELGGHSNKKESKVSPLSTLEPSFEALNLKSFDVAFTVDPLYHQTSAQFDEGGAKGLLLNNLGVYGRCCLLFDSSEVPENSIVLGAQNDRGDLIDLSFAEECIEQMMIHMPVRKHISPTFRDIMDKVDQDNRSVGQKTVLEDVEDNYLNNLEGNEPDDCGPWSFDHDDNSSVNNDSFVSTDPNFTFHQEGINNYTSQACDVDLSVNNVASFLSLGLAFNSKCNAWAGPDHWKYRKLRGLDQTSVSASETQLATAMTKNSKQELSDIDFTKSLDKEIVNIFAPPKSWRSTQLPVKKFPCNITLPEDCHYRPESLVRLFVRLDLLFLGRKERKYSDESGEQNHAFDLRASWDSASMADDQCDDGHVYDDADENVTLVSQPHQVNKVYIQYDMVSKQVDVHVLKEMLWNHIQNFKRPLEVGCEATVSFRQMMHHLPNYSAAAHPNDISPHLVFICLLHLANEHCLSIYDRPSLDELDIHVPLSIVK